VLAFVKLKGWGLALKHVGFDPVSGHICASGFVNGWRRRESWFVILIVFEQGVIGLGL
jgi:hypothetical protein